MKFSLLPLLAAVAIFSGCGNDKSTKPATPAKEEPNYNTGNPITAPVDYLGASVQAQKHAEKVIDVSYLNQAIQLFNAQEGRLPKTLDELVPNYVGKLPTPPFGYRLDYDAATGTAKVVKQ